MCGILGVGGDGGEELVARLLPGLAHRGPDDSGLWSDRRLSLGHRRLAIIGLDLGGRQPMWSRSGDSVIVFNGEIYNYLELADALETEGRQIGRRYDTAVLLEALEAWGLDALCRLDGMFAFAWYRPRTGRLLLVRDRWGKKPLFWGQVKVAGRRRLLFSSELRSFTELPEGPPPVDPLGVARYLVYDGLPDERTVYAGVAKVAPGTWLELDLEGRELKRGAYWSFDPEPVDIDDAEATEIIQARLDRALELRLRSDVPVGLFLSGGLDSSILAATWRRLRPDETLRTFTVGFDDSSYDERASARVIASRIGSQHHEIVATGEELEHELDWVWDRLSEPFADPSLIPTSMLCRLARQHVTVALGGDGADELQAGYDPFRAWTAARWMERLLPRRFWHRALDGLAARLPPHPRNFSTRFKLHHFAQGFEHPAEERVQGWMASFPLREALLVMHPDLRSQVDVEEVLEPTRRAYLRALPHGELKAQIAVWVATYLESSILAKIDRAGMMCSLEVRSPFLDPDLASALAALPKEWIFHHGRGKVLLRELARHELQLPVETLRKPKKGLGVPQASWLRTVLRPRMEAAIEATRCGGWFDPEPIERRWKAHLSERADHRRSLWNFLLSSPFQGC